MGVEIATSVAESIISESIDLAIANANEGGHRVILPSGAEATPVEAAHALYRSHPTSRRLVLTRGFPQKSPEWFEQRRLLLTASVASQVLPLKNPQPFYARGFPWNSRSELGLFESKVGLVPRFSGNAYTELGILWEPRTAELYAEQYLPKNEVLFHDLPLAIHPQYPEIGASLDAMTSGCDETDTEPINVELKCCANSIEKGMKNSAPFNYWAQCQIQMQVSDTSHSHLVFIYPHISETELQIFNIEREDEWFESNLVHFRGFVDKLRRYHERTWTWAPLSIKAVYNDIIRFMNKDIIDTIVSKETIY